MAVYDYRSVTYGVGVSRLHQRYKSVADTSIISKTARTVDKTAVALPHNLKGQTFDEHLG